MLYLKSKGNKMAHNTDELGMYTRPRSLIKVHFLNPRPCEIRLSDIAYHLARSCRFNNAIEPHYSVAEHSVLMANYMWEKKGSIAFAQEALVHDCHEYLFGDIPATIKKLMTEYKEWENQFDHFLLPHLGLDRPIRNEVKLLDRRMCATEQLVLRGHQPDTYDGEENVTLENDITFCCWSWEEAQAQFLIMFNLLFPEYKDVEE
jgi:uncharacterized protein